MAGQCNEPICHASASLLEPTPPTTPGSRKMSAPSPRHMRSPKAARHHILPDTPEFDDEDDNDFDWSTLDNTKPIATTSTVVAEDRQSEATIYAECSDKLRALSIRLDNPPGLKQLINGTKAIMAQTSWETLIVYSDRDDDYPDYKKLWSHVEWRRCEVVEHLTELCVAYYTAVRECKGLDTEEVDGLALGVVREVLELEEAEDEEEMEGEGDGVIEIREWGSRGTAEFFSVEALGIDEGGDIYADALGVDKGDETKAVDFYQDEDEVMGEDDDGCEYEEDGEERTMLSMTRRAMQWNCRDPDLSLETEPSDLAQERNGRLTQRCTGTDTEEYMLRL
ncbi:hypothetical protein LTR37_002686 [Vermiconidia calcicola]|uniref:Uncharacterized protein n=1 Tax=Vermiconidia calcicola TaxID=1690605 RepID=A0ACC3NSR0_9PEZI|nr:hypothetical protein LTR37_002686 [Vermiconidia calcicola]